MVTPSDKKMSTTWSKTGIFFTPLWHKLTWFFYPPRTCFYLVTPPDSYVQFYPLGQFFPPILPRSDSIFINFIPLGQLFPHILPHSDSLVGQFYPPQTFFRKYYPPRKPFFETPLGQKLQFFTPQDKILKGFSVPPSYRVIWPSRTKRPFPPPPHVF